MWRISSHGAIVIQGGPFRVWFHGQGVVFTVMWCIKFMCTTAPRASTSLVLFSQKCRQNFRARASGRNGEVWHSQMSILFTRDTTSSFKIQSCHLAASIVWLAPTLCKKNECDLTLQCRYIEENVLTPQARLSKQAILKPQLLWTHFLVGVYVRTVPRRRCKTMGGCYIAYGIISTIVRHKSETRAQAAKIKS